MNTIYQLHTSLVQWSRATSKFEKAHPKFYSHHVKRHKHALHILKKTAKMTHCSSRSLKLLMTFCSICIGMRATSARTRFFRASVVRDGLLVQVGLQITSQEIAAGYEVRQTRGPGNISISKDYVSWR